MKSIPNSILLISNGKKKFLWEKDNYIRKN